MNDNVLLEYAEPEAAKAPARSVNGFKLDWETWRITMGGGRFAYEFGRPTHADIFARSESVAREIEIGRDNSYKLPDPTVGEDIDAAFFDTMIKEVVGFDGREVPQRFKAAAVSSLYSREIDLDEGCDIFDDELVIVESIGTGDEPDFVIKHSLRTPTEDELRRYRRRSVAGEVKPGKRGRQIFKPRPTLKAAVEFYDLLFQGIDGVYIGDGQRFDESNRAAFVEFVDPIIKDMVIDLLVSKLTDALSD